MKRAKRIKDKCTGCLCCEKYVVCPAGKPFTRGCSACGACYTACPAMAVRMVEDTRPRKKIQIYIDGERHYCPARITVKASLVEAGFIEARFACDGNDRGRKNIYAPCGVGGCYACAVVVDGELVPACVTAVRNGMHIETSIPRSTEPLRVVSGVMPHSVGGVGTPYQLKKLDRYIELAAFTHGCNFRCRQCQNSDAAFTAGGARALTPKELSTALTRSRKYYGLERIALSGGEPTLNMKWLLETFNTLRTMNPSEVHIHLDTNGSLLTADYIDALVRCGMTDIGIDLKALELDTFMHITCTEDSAIAERYKNTAWDAVKYIIDNYSDKLFLGVGIPYNRELITLEEVRRMGERLARIDPKVQVCALDYRPEFRRMHLARPSVAEMLEVRNVLTSAGLERVMVQTALGHIGPDL